MKKEVKEVKTKFKCTKCRDTKMANVLVVKAGTKNHFELRPCEWCPTIPGK